MYDFALARLPPRSGAEQRWALWSGPLTAATGLARADPGGLNSRLPQGIPGSSEPAFVAPGPLRRK